jgi:hypothetical protein
MKRAREFVDRYLELMRCGKGEFEDALRTLSEADSSVLPILIDAVNKPENSGIRPRIVHAIWQQRNPETIGFLAGLLRDADDEVWKEALDGLVTIGGSKGRAALRLVRDTMTDQSKAEWIDEALDQITA